MNAMEANEAASPNSSIISQSDWDEPFTDKQLEAIDAAFEAAAAPSNLSPLNLNNRRPHRSDVSDADRPPKIRRLPDSIRSQVDPKIRKHSTSDQGSSAQKYDSFALLPCPRNMGYPEVTTKTRYPAMSFGGEIVYSRTFKEVENAAMEILKYVESKKEDGPVVLGVDIEWKPTFHRGTPPGKAAVLQICGNMTRCYVMHIIHSGIPQKLRHLLQDPSFLKVGVGIGNDAVKISQDHNVPIRPVEEISCLANQKLYGGPRQWGLSSLVEMLIRKQLPKPKKIRLGNWETRFLSKPQLLYAATDAFASWYLYEALKGLPDKSDS